MMTLLFSGLTTDRIGRGAFAKGFAVQLLLLVGAGVAYGVLAAAGRDGTDGPPSLAVLLFFVLCIPALWVGLVLSVKRIRDWGVSGWWVVPIGVVSAIPVVGGLIGVVVAIMYFAVPTDAFARAPSSAPAV